MWFVFMVVACASGYMQANGSVDEVGRKGWGGVLCMGEAEVWGSGKQGRCSALLWGREYRKSATLAQQEATSDVNEERQGKGKGVS